MKVMFPLFTGKVDDEVGVDNGTFSIHQRRADQWLMIFENMNANMN